MTYARLGQVLSSQVELSNNPVKSVHLETLNHPNFYQNLKVDENFFRALLDPQTWSDLETINKKSFKNLSMVKEALIKSTLLLPPALLNLKINLMLQSLSKHTLVGRIFSLPIWFTAPSIERNGTNSFRMAMNLDDDLRVLQGLNIEIMPATFQALKDCPEIYPAIKRKFPHIKAFLEKEGLFDLDAENVIDKPESTIQMDELAASPNCRRGF